MSIKSSVKESLNMGRVVGDGDIAPALDETFGEGTTNGPGPTCEPDGVVHAGNEHGGEEPGYQKY